MKKNLNVILSVAILFMATDISLAQSYSLYPNDSIVMDGMLEDLQTLSIEEHNSSSNTIYLKWKKISESVPTLWEASVCDNKICFTTLVDSGSMNPAAPGDYGFLLLHVTPHVNYGTAIIRYAVWDVANPAMKDTLTYILTSNSNSGISEIKSKNDFIVYPNPSKEIMHVISNLPAGFEYIIYESTGKEVEKGICETNTHSVITGAWSAGSYSISIISDKKFIGTKQFVIRK